MGVSTQRALADSLAVTEPSVSRMVAALADTGLLNVVPDPAGGEPATDRNRTPFRGTICLIHPFVE